MSSLMVLHAVYRSDSSVFKRVSSYVFTHGAIVVSVPFKRVSSYVFTHGAIVVSVPYHLMSSLMVL